MSGAGTHKMSVVILTHNRAAEVIETVRQMRELPERPPLVVVDNASSDGTAEALTAKYPDVTVIRLEKNIGAAARNTGARSVSTPYVAFCDDDTVWARGSLARACQLLDDWPGIGALTAHVRVGPQQRDDPACAMMDASPLPSSGLPGKAVLGFLAGACVFRRDTFLALGGYEPRFLIGGEEALLAMDLIARGYLIVYTKALTVHHYPSTHRDVTQRRRHSVRNALWVAWLRRPFFSAAGCTIDILLCAESARAALSGLLDAARGLPWVLRKRRVIPPQVEALYALLEDRRRAGVPFRPL